LLLAALVELGRLAMELQVAPLLLARCCRLLAVAVAQEAPAALAKVAAAGVNYPLARKVLAPEPLEV
jgi:hypothetical protein